MTSRKITVKRKESKRYGLPPAIANDRTCNLSSITDKSGNTLRPFTYEEEDKWMQDIVNVKTSDPGFRQAVTNWYKNMRRKVTFEGIPLEIGLDVHNNPLNIEDYAYYKLLLKHPWYGKTEAEVNGDELKMFFTVDPQEELAKTSIEVDLISKAYVELTKLIEDETKTDCVLRALSVRYSELGSVGEIAGLKPEEKKAKLNMVLIKDPSYFVEVAADPNLLYKAQIASMVSAGILTQEGQKYIMGTTSLGTMNATISWMKDPNNAADYTTLLVRLEEFGAPIKEIKKELKDPKKTKTE